MIGELINNSFARATKAFKHRDVKGYQHLAKVQTELGADYLTLNIDGTQSMMVRPQEMFDFLPDLIPAIQEVTDVPLAFDPPVADPSEFKTREVASAGGQPAYKLQAEPARKLKNLQGIPIAYVTAERSGRNPVPVVEFLKQAGCNAESLALKDKGILGNGHFMMLETNRKQVFDVIHGWILAKVPARA